jgi:hypothetical protein
MLLLEETDSMKISWIICIILITAAALSAQGPFCSNQTSAGTYAVTCSGWTAAGPGGTLVPVMQVGTAKGDENGNWAGSTTLNIAGQIVLTAPVSGKAVTNPDCTGSVTYNKGTPNELNISYVVIRDRGEIHGLVVDKGQVVACVLTRISK